MVLTDNRTFSPSLLERFAVANPGTEIWWDSSPLVFETWRAQMLEAADLDHRWELAEQLLRLWDPENPSATLFRGVTTNPPLSLAAIRDDPSRWATWIASYHAAKQNANVEEIFWALYKEIVRLGAAAFKPLHESSGYRYGHISAQVDPRYAFDTEAMLHQASELAVISPNVMIKVPGTREGLPVLRELTRRGISTNCTLAYTVSQFVAVAEEVQAGLAEARAADIDLTGWKSVVTDMCARWENAPEFATQALDSGVALSSEDRRWAGIAIFKQAQRIFRRRAYPSKMLLCSVRMGPVVDGADRCWHLEHTAGADAVFTLPPGFLGEFIQRCSTPSFDSRIWDELPIEIMAKLRKVPYFNQGHDLAGIPVDEFNDIPSLQSTAHEFSTATNEMVTFVRDHVAPAHARAISPRPPISTHTDSNDCPTALHQAELVVRTIAQTAVDNENYFSELDAVVADGDFGYSLARGFEVVLEDWDAMEYSDVSGLLKKTAITLSKRIGGTSGPIWGTAFLRAGGSLTNIQAPNRAQVIAALRTAIEGIKQRGSSDVGDKTLLDALVPAVDELEAALPQGTGAAIQRAAAKARESAEATKGMLARRGRAAYTGERSRDSVDAGAIGVAVIFEAVSKAWQEAGLLG
jgi:transaldolase